MTIDEAIQYFRDTALTNDRNTIAFLKSGQTMLAAYCEKRAEIHEQVAEWLEELKQRREQEKHGFWIECDYKELRHGEIWTEHRAGLCCSVCRTGFKKSKMTFKQYCAACGAKMEGDFE